MQAPIPPPSSQLIPGSGRSAGKIILTAAGAQRIGLQTATARRVPPPPPPAPRKTTAPPKTTAAGKTTASVKTTTAVKTTATVKPPAAPPAPKATVIIPFSAIVYDPSGKAYAFTNPAPLTFVEVPVSVDHISGNSAYLLRGPRAGTKIVTVGAEELYGVQTGVLAQT